jgi:hypothetical protein
MTGFIPVRTSPISTYLADFIIADCRQIAGGGQIGGPITQTRRLCIGLEVGQLA